MAFVVPGGCKMCLRKIRLYLRKGGIPYTNTDGQTGLQVSKITVLFGKDSVKSDLTAFASCNICLNFVNFS